MKKIFAIAILLFSVTPLWSIDSKEMEEIINSITGSDTYFKEKNSFNGNHGIIEKEEAKEQEKTKSLSYPSPDEALLNNGIQLYEAALYNNSKQNFEELRIRYPESPYRDLASIWLSKIEDKLNNFGEAINILNSIDRESGEYPAALLSLGEIHLKAGNEVEAIENFYKIPSLFPDHELADDSLIFIAELYLKNNKGNQALEAVIKVIKDYKERETLDDAYFLMAQVFEKDPLLKDFSIARRIYKIFLKKAREDKAPNFYNSPLKDKVENNLNNIESTYYSKAFID